jgi:hypothetical protein
MKILLKSPRRHLVRLQGKLKLKKKTLHIRKFFLYEYFSVFQCRPATRQPISVADIV